MSTISRSGLAKDRHIGGLMSSLRWLTLFVLILLAVAATQAHSGVAKSSQGLSANELVDLLNLDGHVEGGFFRRTYAADYTLLTPRGDERLSMTSIFYLLAAQSPIGHFHVNRSDIVHYFHLGDPITYYLVHPDGQLEMVVMGNDLRAGQRLQMTVPGGVWKASQIPADGEHGFGLVSEAVSPGFEYADMTLGYRDELLKLFPQHEKLIRRLSHADMH